MSGSDHTLWDGKRNKKDIGRKKEREKEREERKEERKGDNQFRSKGFIQKAAVQEIWSKRLDTKSIVV